MVLFFVVYFLQYSVELEVRSMTAELPKEAEPQLLHLGASLFPPQHFEQRPYWGLLFRSRSRSFLWIVRHVSERLKKTYKNKFSAACFILKEI